MPSGPSARCRKAVQLQPDLAEAWAELAALHAARGDLQACDAAYANFTRLAPPERHLAEAAAALAARRLPAAEALLRARLARSPRDVGALRLLAEVAAEREDYVEAERLLGECLRLAPGYSDARLDLARVLHSQQKAAPILPLVERLLALEPDSFRYRTLQASALQPAGTERPRAADPRAAAHGVPGQRAAVAVLRTLAAHRRAARAKPSPPIARARN